MLIIRRTSAWGDHLRNYKVILDGEEIGHIADGETFEYDIVPGEHILYLKIDYARSEKLHFNVKKNNSVEFVCSPGITGFKILFIFFYLTILSTRYIKLERVS